MELWVFVIYLVPGERPIEMLAIFVIRDKKSLSTVLIFVFVGIWRLEVLFSINERKRFQLAFFNFQWGGGDKLDMFHLEGVLK
jgi:hypothetical protein